MKPAKPVKKLRLDQLVAARGLAESREQARRLILAGRVRSGDRTLDKPGHEYPEDIALRVEGPPSPYVGRGGIKLAGALDQFRIRPTADMLCLDVGASTGGFTDCMLQRGAGAVIAVDTGRGQIHEKLRADPRVRLFENFNARHMTPESIGGQPVDLAAIDVSFISLKLILPAVAGVLRPGGAAVALVKPQFEAGKGQVGSGGIVRDPAVREAVLRGVVGFMRETGWTPLDAMASPITGADGNVEFLVYARRPGPDLPADSPAQIENAIARSLAQAPDSNSGG